MKQFEYHDIRLTTVKLIYCLPVKYFYKWQARYIKAIASYNTVSPFL